MFIYIYIYIYIYCSLDSLHSALRKKGHPNSLSCVSCVVYANGAAVFFFLPLVSR